MPCRSSSDAYMLVRADRSVLSKREVLRDLQASGLTFNSIEIADVEVLHLWRHGASNVAKAGRLRPETAKRRELVSAS
jgi:hypothetical protein